LSESRETNTDEDSEERPPFVDLSSIDTYDVLRIFIQILSTQAWYHMGLRTAPGSEEIKKDFDRARLSVDTVAFLTEKLKPTLSEEESEGLDKLVTDLQINFARQLKDK
jgi:hypothetical protein